MCTTHSSVKNHISYTAYQINHNSQTWASRYEDHDTSTHPLPQLLGDSTNRTCSGTAKKISSTVCKSEVCFKSHTRWMCVPTFFFLSTRPSSVEKRNQSSNRSGTYIITQSWAAWPKMVKRFGHFPGILENLYVWDAFLFDCYYVTKREHAKINANHKANANRIESEWPNYCTNSSCFGL